MNSVCLQVFVTESSRHHGKLTYEWLLDSAQGLGVAGGSAFQALAGFGRHDRHDAGFFELAGELPVEVEFLLDEVQCESLLERIRTLQLRLFYVKMPAEFGVTQ